MRARSLIVLLALIALIATRAAAQRSDADEDGTPSEGAATLSAHAVTHPSGAGAATVSAEHAREQPGTLGEAGRAITNLPGVARASFDSGELVIWGSPTQEQRIYVDGVEIPALFHPGGLRTTLHPALIASLALTPAAPGPELGRALAGSVELETRTLPNVTHADISLDPIDASAAVGGALGPARGMYALRVGYLDRLQQHFAPRARDVVPIPAYVDGGAKLSLGLAHDAELSALWIGSHDRTRFGTAQATETRLRDFQLGTLRYAREFRDGARVVISPSVSSHRFATRSERLLLERRRASGAELQLNELRYGLRAHYALRKGSATLQLGFDGLALRSTLARAGSLTLPAREGDVPVFGQPPGDEIASDRWSSYDVNAAPYARLGLRAGGWSVATGLRLETYALSTSRRTPRVAGTPEIGHAALYVQPEPRLQARAGLAPWLALDARAGIQHQAPAAEDRSAVFGNPRLGPARSYAAAAGPVLVLGDVLDLELTGFYRRMQKLAVRSAQQPPTLAELLVQDGSGRSYGLQVELKLQATAGLSGGLAYTLSRAERSAATGAWRAFDRDQPHVLSALLSYRLAGFELGTRLRFASGSPRREVTGAYYDVRDDRYEPLYDALGEARLPDFFALDMRAEHGFSLGALRWSTYLDVLNVTDHRNVEAIAYDYDFGARQDVIGMPLMAVIGVRLQR